jgi:hypothetical protein
VLSRRFDNVQIDIDGDDLALRANYVSHQSGVIPRTGPDFQHPMARLQVKLLQHNGHDGRLGRGADKVAI